MNNYRRTGPRPRRTAAVDGIIAGTPRHRLGEVPEGRKAAPAPRRRIGDFNTTDGFHHATPGSAIPAKAPATGRQPKRDALGRIDLDLPEAAPKGRKGRTKKKTGWATRAKKTAIMSLVAVLLVGGYLFGKGYLNARNIFRGGGGAAALDENVDPSKLRGEGDGRVNILLLGKGGKNHAGGELTDTIMIASLDPIQKEAALLSIPRDLYVRTDSGYTKINAVYVNAKNSVLNGRRIDNQAQKAEEAGLNAIDKTVEEHLGVPIHYHVMVDFNGFERAIDEVGGIEIDVKQPVYEVMHINGRRYVLDVKQGRQKFDGFRALAYARSRKSPRGDFDRSERQRLILVALKDKILSAGTFANPKKVSGLMDAFGDNVQANLSLSEIMRLYELGRDIDSDKIASLSLVDPPHAYATTANINGLSVVVPKAGLNDYSEIKSYVRNALRDAFLKKEEATIAVYNGTTIPGLAGARASDLRSYGYNISAVADAPSKGYTKTVLVDLRGGSKKYTLNYLQQRLKTTAVTRMPDSAINPGNADFVIILGTDAGNSY